MEHRQLAPTVAAAPDIFAPSHNFLHANEPDPQARFIYDEKDPEVCAVPEETPIDERTKLPLPLLPYEQAAETSWHHHAHPSISPLLKAAGGLVVRTVRLQLTEGLGGKAKADISGYIPKSYGEHMRYHYFYSGPPLPETEKEQFEYAVWAASGYIPENAVNVRGNKPKIVKMKPHQISRLHNGEIKVGSHELLKDFLKDYVLKQDLSHISPNIIDEFVNTQVWNRKRFLGRWLLAQASEVATEQLSEPFALARKKGLVNPMFSHKVANNVVNIGVIPTQKREQAVIQQFHSRLAKTTTTLQTGVNGVKLAA